MAFSFDYAGAFHDPFLAPHRFLLKIRRAPELVIFKDCSINSMDTQDMQDRKRYAEHSVHPCQSQHLVAALPPCTFVFLRCACRCVALLGSSD